MAFVVPAVPLPIWGLANGHYGISYDISLHDTEDDLPNGWHSHRANTSRNLIAYLRQAGYTFHQYSDYSRQNSNPVAVWNTMLLLCQIPPPGKLQSTLSGLKMYYVPHFADMDVTNNLRLGGAFSTALVGPTPVGLVARVPPGILNPAPVFPGPGFVRPHYTDQSANADNPNIYRV